VCVALVVVVVVAVVDVVALDMWLIMNERLPYDDHHYSKSTAEAIPPSLQPVLPPTP